MEIYPVVISHPSLTTFALDVMTVDYCALPCSNLLPCLNIDFSLSHTDSSEKESTQSFDYVRGIIVNDLLINHSFYPETSVGFQIMFIRLFYYTFPTKSSPGTSVVEIVPVYN